MVANQKDSDLTQLTGAEIATNDRLRALDVSVPASKTVTIEALAQGLGLGKLVASGYNSLPTWIDPDAADWADVVANGFSWVQFAYSAGQVVVTVGVGDGSSFFTTFVASASGGNLIAQSGDGFQAGAVTYAGSAQLYALAGSTQTDPLLVLYDSDSNAIFGVAPDGSVGGVTPNTGDVIKWDGSKWVAQGLPVSGYAGWWDASNLLSVDSTGHAVTRWRDLSINQFHVEAAVTARPTTGTTTQNGLNTLLFNGTANFLAGTCSVAAANTGTWFAVIVPSSTGSNERVLTFDAGGNDYDNTSSIAAILRNSTNAKFGLYYNNAMRDDVSVTNAAHVITTQRNGATSEAWCDGVSDGATAGLGTSNFGFTQLAIGALNGGGGSSFFTGQMGEVIWYPTALGSTDRQAVEAYLKAKWGTP